MNSKLAQKLGDLHQRTSGMLQAPQGWVLPARKQLQVRPQPLPTAQVQWTALRVHPAQI